MLMSSSLKDIKKKINHNLFNLVQWCRPNKISLNVSKMDIVIFKSHSKKVTKHLNVRSNGQKIIPNLTKHRGFIIDEHLPFKEYMAQLRHMLNRTNGLPEKLRYKSQVSHSKQSILHFLTLIYAMKHNYGVKVTAT